MTTREQEAASDREVVISRLINAPRELTFAAWTDAAQIGIWWGPRGFTTTTQEIDVRPGGVWRFVMHGPDGTDYDNVIDYLEIVEPERMVFDHGDGSGAIQFRSVVTFEALGEKTFLTLRSVFPTAEERDRVVREYHAIEGGNQTLDRLEAYLAAAA